MTPESVASVAKLVAAGAVISLVTSLGLGVAPRQLLWVVRHPGLLLRSIVAVLVLVPLAALLVAVGFGLESRAVVGIVLMGVSPAAPLVLWRASQARGDTDFAPGLQVALACLAIVSVPASLGILSWIFPASRAAVDPWLVAAQVGRVQLVPLAFGMALRAAWPGLAGRLALPLARLALVLLLAFVAVALALRGPDLLRIGPRAYAAVALTVAVSIALGHLLGGPSPRTRTVLAVASSMRNPGLALLVVQVNFPGRGVGEVLLAYALATLVFLTAYLTFRARRARAAGPAPGGAG